MEYTFNRFFALVIRKAAQAATLPLGSPASDRRRVASAPASIEILGGRRWTLKYPSAKWNPMGSCARS